MRTAKQQQQQRLRRRARIRAKVYGTADKPRLAMYKSNKFVYGQLINDEQGHTLAAASSRDMSDGADSDRAYNAGQELAKAAAAQGIERAVFDRGGFVYTGRIRSFADGAREGGLHM